MADEQPPAWFTDGDGDGRRLSVLENEHARQAWYADRGLPDPARVDAERRLTDLHDDD